MLLFSWRLRGVIAGVAGCLGACQAPSTPAAPGSALHRVIPAQRILADLTLFQHLKEAAHPGIYKYRTKARMDSAFAAARARVTAHMTVLDVYRLVVGVTDFEGSLHNETSLPDSVRGVLEAETAYFPYPLKLVAGQVVLNTSHSSLPLGAIINSINGVPAGQLVQVLGKYYTTDGLNTTGKTVGFASSFPRYFRLEYGPHTSFTVRYHTPGAPTIRQQTLPAVTYPVYRQAFAARHSRPNDRSFFEEMPAKYTFRLLPQRATALLTLNTFDIGEDDSEGHRRYARFLDSCFWLLRRSPAITNLLVDVRGNGGGDDDNDMLAFAYLAKKPFREHKGATMSFSRVPYRQYLTVERDTAERAAFTAAVAQEARTDFTAGPDGRLHGNAQGNPLFQPQAAHFRGRLYLLISPRVASAGSMFAAMVRGNTSAVVIGEETMGGYYGHTGHASLDYTLPNTGIQVSFFRVDLVQDVPFRATQPFGRGVLPDFAVTQSRADFLANEDTQLRFALQLIAAKQ